MWEECNEGRVTNIQLKGCTPSLPPSTLLTPTLYLTWPPISTGLIFTTINNPLNTYCPCTTAPIDTLSFTLHPLIQSHTQALRHCDVDNSFHLWHVIILGMQLYILLLIGWQEITMVTTLEACKSNHFHMTSLNSRFPSSPVGIEPPPL